MKDKNIKNKPVYFNISNQKEKEILEYANDSILGFSGLVKQLIYKEMINEKRLEQKYKKEDD
ncbi:MAG: hypothetical protein II309_01520 [Bacilli bacterium]|nr:hypothetical protein [Bacilli bacterium]